ncbi:hypothetical protein PG990_009075 [Apiospora arundinis]
MAWCRLRLLVPECGGHQKTRLCTLSVIGNTGHLTHKYHAVEILLESSSNWERLIVWFWASHPLDKAPFVLLDGYWSSTIGPHVSGAFLRVLPSPSPTPIFAVRTKKRIEQVDVFIFSFVTAYNPNPDDASSYRFRTIRRHKRFAANFSRYWGGSKTPAMS